MPIWKTLGIQEEPELELVKWQIVKVASPLWEGDSYHFVGYHLAGWEGRVSSQIVKFDPVTMEGVTNSGRKYKLVGVSGKNRDASYVFSHWANRNQLSSITPVSPQEVQL